MQKCQSTPSTSHHLVQNSMYLSVLVRHFIQADVPPHKGAKLPTPCTMFVTSKLKPIHTIPPLLGTERWTKPLIVGQQTIQQFDTNLTQDTNGTKCNSLFTYIIITTVTECLSCRETFTHLPLPRVCIWFVLPKKFLAPQYLNELVHLPQLENTHAKVHQ